MSYNLVIGLTKQFLPDGTNPLASCLPILERLIEQLLEFLNILSRCIWMWNILHKAFIILVHPISWRNHTIKNIYVIVKIPSGLGFGSRTFWLLFAFLYYSMFSDISISASYLIKEKGPPLWNQKYHSSLSLPSIWMSFLYIKKLYIKL